MEMIKGVLIKNIKALRKNKGWTQEQFAEACGYSVGFIKSIESGRHGASMDAMDKFCEALDVTCGELFSTNGDGKLLDMPMSKAVQKLMAVPDEVYELASKLGPKSEAWGVVIDYLEAELIKQGLDQENQA